MRVAGSGTGGATPHSSHVTAALTSFSPQTFTTARAKLFQQPLDNACLDACWAVPAFSSARYITLASQLQLPSSTSLVLT
jgi:hypothetical protein